MEIQKSPATITTSWKYPAHQLVRDRLYFRRREVFGTPLRPRTLTPPLRKNIMAGKEEVIGMEEERKSRVENEPARKGELAVAENAPMPTTLEELKRLLGDDFRTKNQNELEWILRFTQEKVRKNGEDWVKNHRVTLLRQWEYVKSLM